MINRLKELIKTPIYDKYNAIYEYCLDESVKSYDTYVRTLDEKHYENLKSYDEKVAIVEYKELLDGFELKDENVDYILFTADKAGLDEHAANLVAEFFNRKAEAQVIYGDEDEWNNPETVRMNPYYKPDWSPDTLGSFFYFGNCFAIRKQLLSKNTAQIIDMTNVSDDIGAAYDLALKLTAGMKAKEVYHINAALFHSHNLKSLCDDKKYRDIREHYIASFPVAKDVKNGELVSIVIPSKDNPVLVKNVTDSICKLTSDVEYEIILIDNGSSDENKQKIEEIISDKKKDGVDITYVYEPQPFNFSRICNHGAKASKGNMLLFLNDDIEVRVGNWLKKMVRYARMAHVGAVGAKLYYPDSLVIQHAGITNLRVGPVHKLQYKEDRPDYYFHSTDLPRDVLGVTGACLLIRKELFNEMGGFSEELEVAFNDVDLCFRLHEFGYMNVVCNDTHLYHHESFSRGGDEERGKLERLLRERNLLYVRHPRLYAKDPFYSKYLQMNIADVNYSFAYEYDMKKNEQKAVPGMLRSPLREEERNDCVSISIEWAGDRNKWLDNESEPGEDIYIQGFSFVAGSDNSLYFRAVMLEGENGTFIFTANDVYRPEIEQNIDPIHMASMCGFEMSFPKSALPEGEYRVGVIAFSRYSKNRLYNYTNRYIKI